MDVNREFAEGFLLGILQHTLTPVATPPGFGGLFAAAIHAGVLLRLARGAARLLAGHDIGELDAVVFRPDVAEPVAHVAAQHE